MPPVSASATPAAIPCLQSVRIAGHPLTPALHSAPGAACNSAASRAITSSRSSPATHHKQATIHLSNRVIRHNSRVILRKQATIRRSNRAIRRNSQVIHHNSQVIHHNNRAIHHNNRAIRRNSQVIPRNSQAIPRSRVPEAIRRGRDSHHHRQGPPEQVGAAEAKAC